MSWTLYQVLLYLLMIVTGCMNTLALKWSDDVTSVGRDGTVRKFRHPFIQTMIMFFGQIFCYITFCFLFFLYSRRGDGSVHEMKLTKGNRDFCPFILFIPAMCDMIASSLMFIGLNLTFASSYQMLRGGVIVFVGLLSIFVLKQVLLITQWTGILLVTGGLMLVGIADYIFNENPLRKHTIDSIIVGDLLVVLSQLLAATQFVLEEKYVTDKEIPPLLVVGWEGIFGFMILGALLIPLWLIKAGRPFSNGPYGSIEDAADAVTQIWNSNSLLAAFTILTISVAVYNFAGISMTKEMSATTRVVLDSLNTMVIWMFSILLFEEKFNWLQMFGFVVLVLGMCLYNGVSIPSKKSDSYIPIGDLKEIPKDFGKHIRREMDTSQRYRYNCNMLPRIMLFSDSE